MAMEFDSILDDELRPSRVWAVYVTKTAPGPMNFEIGLEAKNCGWKRALAVLPAIQSGDFLLLASGGKGNPRVPQGGWADRVVDLAVLCEVTTPVFESSIPCWPDDVYPFRVEFVEIERRENPQPVEITPEVLEALRFSANTQGAP